VLSIRKILHPTDYSELSRLAFELACSIARDFGAELILCHVAPPVLTAVDQGIVVEIPTGETEQMTNRLEQLRPDTPRIRVTYKLLRGHPAEEIIRLAGDARADLIVIGTHGRSGFGRVLMGSVAEAVMRKAACPVVTVKAQAPGRQPVTD
jgi:nucleotide-binding universal stress UspA family protein